MNNRETIARPVVEKERPSLYIDAVRNCGRKNNFLM
jgi:hypothetical protein